MAKVKALTERPPLPDGPRLRQTGSVQPPASKNTMTQLNSVPTVQLDANLDPPAPMAPGTFTILRNSTPFPVIPNGFKSNVMEPSTAIVGRTRFMTGNWFAAFTNNDGGTWTHVSPFTAFPSADGGFCCDQVVIYDPSRDMMIWYLQYIKSGSSASDIGRQRIAVFRNTRSGISASGWLTYDILPSAVGGPATGEWMDYPDLALSNDFLWITSNVFSTTTDSYTRSVLIRVPLDNLLAGTPAPLTFFSPTVGTLKMVQGAKDVMYAATHLTTASMRIYRWPENTGSIGVVDRSIPAWINGSHSCPGSTAINWCGRSDSRILAGAMTWDQLGVQAQLWWFWNVAQGGSFPLPYIDAARFQESALTYTARPFLWSSTITYHYVAAAANERGDLGLSINFASNGTSGFPSSAVCIKDDFNSLPPPWACASTMIGSNPPTQSNRWGDYLAVRPAYPGGDTWHASNFSVQGGTTQDNTEPRSIVFGRGRDVQGYQRWFDR